MAAGSYRGGTGFYSRKPRTKKSGHLNKRTGKLVWEAKLPASGFATPSVYDINGSEYLVIACGGVS